MSASVSVLCMRSDVADRMVLEACLHLGEIGAGPLEFFMATGADRVYLCRPVAEGEPAPRDFHDAEGNLSARIRHFDSFEEATAWVREDIHQRVAWLSPTPERVQ